ncbi:hypothetical protein EG832_19190 [bacterium]|nr:hypothetical protein [bacterium]
MSLILLDDTLSVDVYFEPSDDQFADNVCVSLWESCPEDEKLFIADETNIYLTSGQARELARMLLEAVDASERK